MMLAAMWNWKGASTYAFSSLFRFERKRGTLAWTLAHCFPFHFASSSSLLLLLVQVAKLPGFNTTTGQAEAEEAAAEVEERDVSNGGKVVVVCCGHGSKGHEAASRGAELLADELAQPEENEEGGSKHQKRAFDKVNVKLKGEAGLDQRSGTAALAISLSESGEVVVSNCGDLLVVAGMDAGKADSDEMQFASEHKATRAAARELTKRHLTSDSAECARIRDKGGVVTQQEYAKGKASGKPKVFVDGGHKRNGQGPGLAMTRSLGDPLAHSIGVIPTPETSTFRANPSWRYLLVGSDALWQAFSPAEACGWLAKYAELRSHDFAGAAQSLATAAQRKLKRSLGDGSSVDDCVVALVRVSAHWRLASPFPSRHPASPMWPSGRRRAIIAVSAVASLVGTSAFLLSRRFRPRWRGS